MQGKESQKPGRKPDMSIQAAEATSEVLLQMKLGQHTRIAHVEAGEKLRGNHDRVLRDVVNPSQTEVGTYELRLA